MLRIIKTSFSYDCGSPWIIKDCSVEFGSPGTYLISGGNGSGKSTLMDMITGFKKPAMGDVFINNVNLYSSTKTISSLRKIISYMPASLRMPLYLDVSYILDMWMGGYFRDELISALNLHPFMDHKYHSLSDGYRNRVHLAVALSRGAFVLLDEPLKSQDDELKKIFPELISKCRAGRTFIVTSPNIIDDVKWDKKFVLDRGMLK
ncbi:MAG: ATP-binding cassette domain-containing protein [Proteobacteria bacterium]|nr:ATP-binding cassette domain-containing protein [Pseudomonadota bacterium]